MESAKKTMLRMLTHKLRSQSLNQNDQAEKKPAEERDSGTESDEDSAEDEENRMGNNFQDRSKVSKPLSQSPNDSGDPHSSEEELDAITGGANPAESRNLKAGEKRKWSRSDSSCSDGTPGLGTPVEFSASPPRDVVTRSLRSPYPPGIGAGIKLVPHCSTSDLTPIELAVVSPRKKRRPHQRPYLNFEKMQKKAHNEQGGGGAGLAMGPGLGMRCTRSQIRPQQGM